MVAAGGDKAISYPELDPALFWHKFQTSTGTAQAAQSQGLPEAMLEASSEADRVPSEAVPQGKGFVGVWISLAHIGFKLL